MFAVLAEAAEHRDPSERESHAEVDGDAEHLHLAVLAPATVRVAKRERCASNFRDFDAVADRFLCGLADRRHTFLHPFRVLAGLRKTLTRERHRSPPFEGNRPARMTCALRERDEQRVKINSVHVPVPCTHAIALQKLSMETIVCYDLGTGMNDGALRRPRITRAEAATVLGTSYQNVRKLQRKGYLHSNPDRYGVHRFDRREVEELARKRGLQIKPSGELAARVFAMFKANRTFADIVIETQQEPEVIRALWKEHLAGFDDTDAGQEDERVRREHDEQRHAFEMDQRARRRAL